MLARADCRIGCVQARHPTRFPTIADGNLAELPECRGDSRHSRGIGLEYGFTRPPAFLSSLDALLMIRALFVFSLLSGSFVLADIPWPGKTGPTGDGNVARADQDLPLEWDEASGKNISWKIALDGVGHCTPVIGDGRLWFTSATKDGSRQYIYCVDAKSGEVLHHKLLFENPDPEPLGNPINNYAAPTCALESDAVYVHFGTYGTARLDPKSAEVVWKRRDINARHFRGPGSSPVVYDDRLILTFDGIDKQFVTALNKATGETVWTTDRSTDYKDLGADGKPKRDGDMRKAYGTPVVVQVGDRAQVVSVGSMAAFGYDLRSGKEIWTITHDDMNASAQPIAYRDTVIMNTGGRGSNLLGLRLASDTVGNVEDSHIVWDRAKGNSRMSFPVLATPDRLMFVSDTGVVTCVAADSGEQIFTGRIGGNHIASPIVAKGRVYFFTIEGDAMIVDASADRLVVLAENKLDEGMRASPAAAGGALYLRTHGHLYKIQSNN